MDTDPKIFIPVVEKYGKRTERYQNISMNLLFPKRNDGICCCGCGMALAGRRTRYATDDCQRYCESVWGIISGHMGYISGYVMGMYNNKCAKCEETCDLEIDHEVEVCDGGARGWLSNYRPLCKSCHREKTNESRRKRVSL